MAAHERGQVCVSCRLAGAGWFGNRLAGRGPREQRMEGKSGYAGARTSHAVRSFLFNLLVACLAC